MRFCDLYWEYPVIITLRVDQAQSIEFPAVSICNLNRMKTNNEVCDKLKEPKSRKIESSTEFTPKGKPILIPESRNLHRCRNIQSDSNIRDRRNDYKFHFLMKYYRMNTHSRSQNGHNISDLIEECSFNGRPCSTHHLNNFTNLLFGNCVTFNKKVPDKELLRVSKTGIGTGLILKLNIESCYYLPTTHTAGAKVIIHHPNDIPNPEGKGFTLIPGYESLISLKQTVINRLPAPYKDRCFNYNIQENNFFSSHNDCLQACIQERNIAKCGCSDSALSTKNIAHPCRILNESEACCLDDVLKNMSQGNCSCPLPCFSVSYKEMLSKSILSSKAFFTKDNAAVPKRTSGEIFTKNILRVNVFYSTLEKYLYEQKPKWEDTELLSYIGNQLGLWLGLSVASICELVERMSFMLKTVIHQRFLSMYR
ncbi:acid-sensing ion channel 2 [Nephila pilipes]|uniref:Acid-sensing ion channel 2 n=1 Tax=Nephila pilipes TaxID=299642 RepID=A0A8X6T7K7_NEPPI|nr:acid-sensing ion channel 2 [Nephila pilipes]